VKNNTLVSLIDGISQRYGQRPSAIIGIPNERIALDFDIAVAVKASNLEKEEIEEPKNEKSKLDAQTANIKNMQRKGALLQR